jgi:hypoxanthine phosphoribosyltransferase
VSRARTGSYSAVRIASRVKTLGRAISQSYRGRRLDMVVTMDRSFVFAADLVRAIDGPVAVHFVREDVRDVEMDGRVRREVFFGTRGATSGGEQRSEFRGRDVLLVDVVLESGVTQEFLLRRIGEGRPRSLRLAVLLDKASKRRVALEPDYFGFQTASNQMWSGYGLAGSNGLGRNGKALVSGERASGGSKRAKKRKK